jgi:DNA-binding Xre family transcriptional regulator
MKGVTVMAYGGTMARLRVREVAESRGLNMSQLQRASRLTMNMIRRYWYNTADGKAEGPPLAAVYLDALDNLAEALDVEPGELIAPRLPSSE